MNIQPVALTVAGTDPSGGAGIQADLKTFAALGVYGFSVVTMVVAQNSSQVLGTAPVDPEMVGRQVGALMAHSRPQAIKTGALGNAEIVAEVARAISGFGLPAPVVDPVIRSSSGARLLDEEGERTMCKRLLPIAALVTPNLPEAQALSGIQIEDVAGMRGAARLIYKMGPRAVLIKGGHLAAQEAAIDLLYDGERYIEFAEARIEGGDAHGTGCALSAAITAWLARGADLEDAVRKGKAFVTRALRYAFQLGEGRPVLNHPWAGDQLRKEDGTDA
jgi:hydroxymethylpyrimidine/phosphomethylpyrimidine kinase